MCLVTVGCRISASKLTGNWVDGLDSSPMKMHRRVEINLNILYETRRFDGGENLVCVRPCCSAVVSKMCADVSE